MAKTIFVFSVFMACFFQSKIAKDLPNGLVDCLKKYSFDHRHLLEHEDTRNSKNVHKPKLIQESMSGSVSRDHYALKLSGSAHRSANPEMPQVRKVRFKRGFDMLWANLEDCKGCRPRSAATPMSLVSNFLK